jgi:hypothetical protein
MTDPKRVNQILQALEKERAQVFAHLARMQKLILLLQKELAENKVQKEGKTNKPQKEEQQKATPKRTEESKTLQEGYKNNPPITKNQIRYIKALYKNLGWSDSTYRQWLKKLVGKTSTKELTKKEASLVIDRLQEAYNNLPDLEIDNEALEG